MTTVQPFSLDGPARPTEVTDLLTTVETDPFRAAMLQELEAIIARSIQTNEIGKALYTIREDRLYRVKGSGVTFESYCWDRWGFARQTAYDHIKAFLVIENVRTSVQSPPSLSQAVELASLERADQREVAEAIEANGKVFEEMAVRDIRRIVREVKAGTSPADAVHDSFAPSSTPPKNEGAASDPPEKAVTRRGDLWSFRGVHKLSVGDARILADVEKLMAGEEAHLAFTDPPYNVDYEGYTDDHLKIQGDRLTDQEFKELLEKAFRSCRAAVSPSASIYVCHASSWQREFQDALEAAGFEIRCQIIWAKNSFGWGHNRYKFQHEPIFYAHVAGQTDPWYGDKTQSTLWQVNKPTANRVHPMMKPVELIERALINSSKVGDIVLDLFGGSGSTLIGCERRKRKARLMEIDPKYADVIIQWWQQFTGRDATLDGDGRTFSEIARVRLEEAA